MTNQKLESDFISMLEKHDVPEYDKFSQSAIDEVKEYLKKTGLSELIDNLKALNPEFRTPDELLGLDPHHNVTQYSHYIEDKLIRFGYEKYDEQYITRLFPISTIDAQAKVLPNGVIILINEGLRNFFTDIYGLLLKYKYVQEAVRGNVISKENIKLSSALVSLFTSYILDGYYKKLVYYDETLLDIESISHFQLLLIHTMYFVVAHEHGHLVSGHLDKNKHILKKTLVGDIELAQKSWDDEFLADKIAARILFNDSFENIAPMSSAISIITFLKVDSFLSRVEDKILVSYGYKVPTLFDHPDSESRIQNILNSGYATEGNIELSHLWGQQMDELLNFIEQAVIESVHKNVC